MPASFNERMTEGRIRDYVKSHPEICYAPATPITHQPLRAVHEVEALVTSVLGSQYDCTALGRPFTITQRTVDHIMGRDREGGRAEADIIRRGHLFLTALDVARYAPRILTIDAVSDRAKKITYYELVGIDAVWHPGRLIITKLSEHASAGLIFWSLIDTASRK